MRGCVGVRERERERERGWRGSGVEDITSFNPQTHVKFCSQFVQYAWRTRCPCICVICKNMITMEAHDWSAQNHICAETDTIISHDSVCYVYKRMCYMCRKILT